MTWEFILRVEPFCQNRSFHSIQNISKFQILADEQQHHHGHGELRFDHFEGRNHHQAQVTGHHTRQIVQKEKV